MDAVDIELRNATYRRFVELGRAPTAGEIAKATERSEADVRDAWRRLHDAHALVLEKAGDIDLLFHVPVPAIDWWRDIGFTWDPG